LGAQPYEKNDPFEFENFLSNEHNRLLKPHGCPDELYDMFRKCWNLDPSSRPNLKNLFYSLAGMRFAIRYRGPFGALLALLVLDRHLRVVHAVWIFYGRHCCNVPLMFPVL
jgi:hypothetical protein